MKAHEIVGTYDLEPIDAGETSESFKFRIEVLRDLNKSRHFFARVYRRETFRVQPTFPISEGASERELADHEILVSDDMIGAEDFSGSSKAAVVSKVKKRIEECFKRTG